MKKVRCGVLGVAKIATENVIPAMQRGVWSEISAIASRDLSKAREAAERLGIPKAYGSYEELLADPEIEAVHNPLPNRLHVSWSISAAEAGKHVLCEKPISLTVDEARQLIAVRDRTGVKIQEAFMVRTRPWLGAVELIRQGRVGPVRSIMGYFSYFQPGCREYPEHFRVRGRRNHGYRLLPDQYLAPCIRGRAPAGSRTDRSRSALQCRPAGFHHHGFPVGTVDRHLQHSDDFLPAG